MEIQELEILKSSTFTEDEEGGLLDVQDAELIHDPKDPLTKKHCPEKCTVVINNKETVAVLDTGVGGFVVSTKYLASKAKTGRNTCTKRQWNLVWIWIDTESCWVIYHQFHFCHERGKLRSSMTFTVMEG